MQPIELKDAATFGNEFLRLPPVAGVSVADQA